MAKQPIITLLTHTHPDGDAIGSTTGLYHFLEGLGYRPTLVLPDPAPANLVDLLPDQVLIHSLDPVGADHALTHCDILIGLDFNQFKRTGSTETAASHSSARKILIDHHLNPDTAAFDQIFSEAGRSSTCELVYYLLLAHPTVQQSASKLSMDTLYSLTTGLITDTNNFNNSLSPATFRMAADVCEAGVDLDRITEKIYRSNRSNRIDLMGFLLNERRFQLKDVGAEYMLFSLQDQKKFDYLSGESEGFVNLPLQTKRVRLSALFTETDEGCIRVSLRSKRGFSANRLAQRFFNGGGHENAAGGKLYLPLDDVAAYFEKAVRTFLLEEDPQ